jgi:SAM-dependent methyltransferase
MKDEQEIIEKLNAILSKTTKTEKHRDYHILPERLNSKIKIEKIKSKQMFYEKERMCFIRSCVDFKNKSILDIGCNTGYFLFSTLDDGAATVTGYEGEELSVEFIEKAIVLLGEENRFKILNRYFDFSTSKEKFDIIFLLNVLHHVGDDYGEKSLTIDDAKVRIIDQLNNLSKNGSILIYQMGFNWQGNTNRCLFENGSKIEMIDFITEGIKNYWTIEKIGIAENGKEGILYKDLSDNNILRNDKLGEFLNRPIFILKSKI